MHRLFALVCVASCVDSSGEPEPPARMGPIDWRNDSTLLRASAVEIDAAGQRFDGAAEVHVGGGMVGATTYTTLEALWDEHGVEMRLFIYLHSDGVEWWADELRHYDGAAQGDWVTYTGDFFRSPVGMPFQGTSCCPRSRCATCS